MNIEVLLIVIVLVGLSFLLLGFNIFFRKDGKFPETEVGKNKNMRKLGITCTRCSEVAHYKKMKKNTRINPSELKLAR
ncbi:MAG: hypothetical protein JXJ22_06025 [Bacteroidales bacterium]|nr:hypothetical protein [Bacteroidales bacterium]